MRVCGAAEVWTARLQCARLCAIRAFPWSIGVPASRVKNDGRALQSVRVWKRLESTLERRARAAAAEAVHAIGAREADCGGRALDGGLRRRDGAPRRGARAARGSNEFAGSRASPAPPAGSRPGPFGRR